MKKLVFGIVLPLILTAAFAVTTIETTNNAPLKLVAENNEKKSDRNTTTEKTDNKVQIKRVKTSSSETQEKEKEKAKQRKIEKAAWNNAEDAISEIIDIRTKELLSKASHSKIEDARSVVKKVKNWKKRKQFNDYLDEAETLLNQLEQNAKEETMEIWDFANGVLILGTTEEDIDAAYETVSKLPEEDLKIGLEKALQAAREQLKQQDTALEVTTVGPEETPSLNGRLGDSGRFYIPSVGIDVALFQATYSYSQNQNITDASDSALFFPRAYISSTHDYNNDPIIGDHCNQGFDGLYNVVAGSTKAYLYDKNGQLSVYRAISKFNGHNTKWWLTDENYNNIELLGNDLITYTCRDRWENVTIVIWECIEGAKFGESHENPYLTSYDEATINLG